MKTRIQKWGNSLALRIPKSFVQSHIWSKACSWTCPSSTGSYS